MKIDDVIYDGIARTYTKHLAEAMTHTRDGLMWQLLKELRWRMEMPRRGRYQIWQGNKLKADRIKHRKEALAMLKMFRGVE